jgi:hypothetical protein
MDWIKWKYRQLKQWLIYFVMYRAFWKKLWVSESDNSKWEILHDSENKTVELHYVPNDDYSNKDVKIKMQYDDFEDLVKFMIRIR